MDFTSEEPLTRECFVLFFHVHKLCPHHMYEIVYGTHKDIDTLGS